MLNSIKALWDIFTQKKYNLVKENITKSYTQEQVTKVLNWEILDPKIDKYRPKDNTAVNLSVKTLLELQKIDLESLEWKSILDIWWWFTGIPFLLEDINCDISIVDPIFISRVNLEIERNKTKIFSLIWDFDQKNYEEYKKWNIEKQEYLYRLNTEFNNILSDLNKWSNLDIENNKALIWKNEVKIYPTTWEELTEIDNESLDIIFINHTITKNQVNPYELLERANQLLKTGWKIYITESWKIDFWILKFFSDEFEVEVIDSYYLNEKTILILEKK